MEKRCRDVFSYFVRMGKLKTLLLAMVAFFAFSGMAHGSPLYYTFEGKVTSRSGHADMLSELSLGVDDTVSYTIMIDRAGTGMMNGRLPNPTPH